MAELIRKAPTQDEAIEMTVLRTALCWALLDARMPLKEGQNIHRNSVPTMATRLLTLLDSLSVLVFAFLLVRTAETANPK